MVRRVDAAEDAEDEGARADQPDRRRRAEDLLRLRVGRVGAFLRGLVLEVLDAEVDLLRLRVGEPVPVDVSLHERPVDAGRWVRSVVDGIAGVCARGGERDAQCEGYCLRAPALAA